MKQHSCARKTLLEEDAVSSRVQGSRGRLATGRRNLPASRSAGQPQSPSALRTPAAETKQFGCGGLRRKRGEAGPRKKLFSGRLLSCRVFFFCPLLRR